MRQIAVSRLLLLPIVLLAASCARSANVDVSQLHVPEGFKIEIFASTGTKPRFMAFSPGGTLLATCVAAAQGDRRTYNVQMDVSAMPAPFVEHEGNLSVLSSLAAATYG